MKELDDKYRKDKLSIEELHALREQVNAASDDALAQHMREVWMKDDIDVSEVDSGRMERLKSKIDAQTRLSRSGKQSFYRYTYKIMRMAAAVLLPLLLAVTFYLYNENRSLASETLTVSTGAREKADITLPDGTAVTLNSGSRLQYKPNIYNKEKRQISFEGEGYFEVAKDKRRPFLIDGDGLQVKVLGTTFNLSVRKNSETAELFLEEGSVLLSSVLTGKSVVLQPDHKAILHQNNGTITVVKEPDAAVASAWKRGEMMFKNASFSEVIRKIEENYEVRIETDYKESRSDAFTGTVTTTDLFEALKIVERIYDLTAKIEGKKIIFLVNGKQGE